MFERRITMRSQLAVLVLLALAVCRPANGMQHGGPPGGGGAGGSGGAGTDRARPGGPGMGGEIPPPAQEMRPQQPRPTDCASLQCKNGGLCQMNANGPFCNCSLVAFCGVACGQAEAECVAKDANREKLQAGTALAGQAKEELAKAKAKCADPAMTMLCPKDVPGGRNGTCVGFMADCFPTAADMTAYREIKNNSCPVGQKLCDQEGICVDVRVSCAPADKCPATKAFRCVDWACADNAQACVALAKEKGPPACAEGQQRCPDGLCYPGTGGVKECVKQVTWLGCPPGSMQCNGGAKGVCAADEASCTEVVGCASPLVKCGFQRNAVTGKPLLNETTGKFVADCRDVCPVSIDRPPKDTTKPLDPREGGELEAMSADGSSAVKLKLPKNAFKVGDSFDTPVNFSVTSVPDSLLQNGAFAAHFNRGALLGALITIEPSAEVQIVGGMTLDIPILDAWANSDAAKCLLILENTKMIAIRDINNVSEIPEPLGTCSKGDIGGCSCLQNVTHFSTFAVVDDTVAYTVLTPAPAGGGGGGVASPAAGASGADVVAKDSKYYVTITVTMPYSKAEFDTAKQDKYKTAVASAAGTIAANIDIVDITEKRRRAGSVNVQTRIRAKDAVGTDQLVLTLGTGNALKTKINAELTKQGLKESTGVTDPYKFSPFASSAPVASSPAWALALAAHVFAFGLGRG